jgi:hypothetical protein
MPEGSGPRTLIREVEMPGDVFVGLLPENRSYEDFLIVATEMGWREVGQGCWLERDDLTHHAEALELLRGYYHLGAEPLRARVVDALGYRCWPEALPFLEDIAANDISPEIQHQAAEVLRRCRAQSGSI